MAETTLLPCPFCGSEAETHETMDGWIVACSSEQNELDGFTHKALACGATEAEAIAAWNTRAERTCEACAFSKPTDLTDGCAALERIAKLEEECDQLREAVAYWQRIYEEQIGVRR